MREVGREGQGWREKWEREGGEKREGERRGEEEARLFTTFYPYLPVGLLCIPSYGCLKPILKDSLHHQGR